ncbi:uncharacterized protein LOC134824434 isoform X2 [Bolinopsis microptera]|uniref:uncharacterized protein LOC134824434 isoform X2 n=1 Tax=Bolinopsis microptera TaxID=2820187 RepID=UPI003078E25E
MRIAVQGCSHGELDNIYESIIQSERETGNKIDILICCGDFQACRNENDLKSMKVPKKHARIASFWKYYSGESVAPCLTIVIGGNHEASNHMWELYYGGWLAPKIYYLGSAGVINVGGVRIGGISGIYKKFDYHKGHHETPPLSPPEIVSVFHVRSLEVMRCKSLQRPVDVFLSHDWPLGVYEYGNKEQLLRAKPFFEEDVRNNELGSPPAAEILETLQPCYWFSGHLHVKFSAIIPHDQFGKCTRFLALDKCLPKRRFLQIVEIGKTLSTPPVLEYDPEWLAILSDTAHFYNPLNFDQKLPPFAKVSKERIEAVSEKFGSMIIPENFSITVPVYGENVSQDRYDPSANPQSMIFCAKLGIKNETVPEGCTGMPGELDISRDSEANMSLNTSARVTRLDNSAINDDTPAKKKEEVHSFKDFSAPEIKTPTKKKSSLKPKSSTPVILKRRLTLPQPKNSSQLSPLKTSPDNLDTETQPPLSESESVPAKKTICLPEITSPEEAGTAAGLIPPGMEEKKEEEEEGEEEEEEGCIIQNKSYTEQTSTIPSADQFDLDETDDDLMSKFLSLKKKFGRGDESLSDSMLVNTSMREAIVKEEGQEEEEGLGNKKKFKMEIHNELDSTDT